MRINHLFEEENLLPIKKRLPPKKIKFNLKKNTYLLPSFKKLEFNIKKENINHKLNAVAKTLIFNSMSTLYPLSRNKVLRYIYKKQIHTRVKMIVLKQPRIKIFKRRRRNKKRKYYYGIKWKKQKYNWIKQRLNYRKKKKRYKLKLQFNNQYLSIRIRRKNSFISLYKKEITKEIKENKKRIKILQFLKFHKKFNLYKVYEKNMTPKAYYITRKTNLIISKSLGPLGYKGRHKTSPVSKETLGRLAGRTAIKNNFSYIDIILKKKIGRLYKPILKGISQYQFLIRRIHSKMPHAHGFVRAKKKKRK